jgi:pimeloyl-ACP methyl ester carboxylesterase
MTDVVAAPDGLPIRYEAVGQGEPAIVLVHGWACDRSVWAGQVAWFGSRHRCVTLDLGGHGESGRARTGWTVATFGDDVVAVADALRLDDMVLVGHSMGGDVIVEAALQMVGRVRGLVWLDTYRELATLASDAESRPSWPRSARTSRGAPARSCETCSPRTLTRASSSGSPA